MREGICVHFPLYGKRDIFVPLNVEGQDLIELFLVFIGSVQNIALRRFHEPALD